MLLLWASQGFAATEISNVRHWAAPDHTRVVFDLSDAPEYSFKVTEEVITLEFTNASFRSTLSAEKKINKPGVSRIVFTATDDHTCKIEIYLKEHLTTEVFTLKKILDKPDRVVVDVIVEEIEKPEPVKDQTQPLQKKRVIVIDPGHGGEDPGAIGKKGTYEKHVVLALGREIKKTIDKMPGYRAVLTRDGDYYVSFSRRLDVARLNAASLFISVHADAAKNRQAKGGSVYCLSTRGATNEAARLLAHNENLSDIIGGVPNGEGKNQSDEIILNMFQTNTINLSKTYATGLIDQLGRVHSLKYPVFQEAPFRVLKLLDTPAVLLETAFLSNAQEEKLLKTVKFRKTIASTVAASVANYFSDASSVVAVSDKAKPGDDVEPQAESPKPPADTAVEVPPVKKPADAAGPVRTNAYRVKRGDTLKKIAEKNETSIAMLLKLNHMKINDPLLSGRKILIPATRPESAGERPLKKYTVKKGDTLFSLAKSSSITVDELRRLNHMKDTDVLVSGRIIRLPQ